LSHRRACADGAGLLVAGTGTGLVESSNLAPATNTTAQQMMKNIQPSAPG